MNKAFTLIELMISLTLMVIMMLGVNYIFTAVGKATGAAQVVSRVGRDQQSAQAVLTSDFSRLVPNAPCLLISSQVQPAFRNRQEQLGALDINNPLMTDAGPQSVTQLGDRSHRIDIISFFARGKFDRQTGDDGQFVADMASNEAWVWYGHLRTPNTSGTYMMPGQGTFGSNTDNFFASQFKLGRVAMLLIEPDAAGAAGKIYDNNGKPRHFMQRQTSASLHSLAPLSQGSIADDNTKNYTARYDVAGTTVEGFRAFLEDDILKGGDLNWYQQMMFDDTTPIIGQWRRYQATPQITKPITSASVASQVPIFLEASSFVVEFAGDFFQQDKTPGSTYSAITGFGKDDEIDFRFANGVKETRWYGFPRDSNNDGKINGTPTSGTGPLAPNTMMDVVPIRDVLLGAGLSMPVYPPPLLNQIQQVFPERNEPTPSPVADYAIPGVILPNGAYRIAWGPDSAGVLRPSLIRITIFHDDSNGRLNQPQVSSFTFSVQ